jgi:shikimate kinase
LDTPLLFMRKQLHMNIVFIGFASCGKSATALEISRRLKLRFIDIDREIETRYARTRAKKLNYRDIIQQEGMPFFFDMEHAALVDLGPVRGCVIAPGGGAPIREQNRELLKSLGIIIYLRTDPAVLFERMQTKGLPLFLREDPSIEHLESLWRERHAVYAQLADHMIDNTHLNISTTADCAMAALRESGFSALET